MRQWGSRTTGLILVALLICVGAYAVISTAREPPPAGIVVISLSSLPPEALKTLELIKRGGPFPYAKDGTVFGNREKLLPRQPRGYYTEYTVRTPGSRDRGARRIVAGGDPAKNAEYYYTDDHYQSFKRIRE